jgi:hypothetical protein
MLTATYTLVALSVEQTEMRVSLHAVQQLVEMHYSTQRSLGAAQAKYVCATLQQLYKACQGRKLDRFLLPALRGAAAGTAATAPAAGAALLLDELARLDATADAALAAVCRHAEGELDDEVCVAAFCTAVLRFCSALGNRFEREESELFPIARAAIAGAAWFALANQMLAHDAWRAERRRRPRPAAGRAPRTDTAPRQALPVSSMH